VSSSKFLHLAKYSGLEWSNHRLATKRSCGINSIQMFSCTSCYINCLGNSNKGLIKNVSRGVVKFELKVVLRHAATYKFRKS